MYLSHQVDSMQFSENNWFSMDNKFFYEECSLSLILCYQFKLKEEKKKKKNWRDFVTQKRKLTVNFDSQTFSSIQSFFFFYCILWFLFFHLFIVDFYFVSSALIVHFLRFSFFKNSRMYCWFMKLSASQLAWLAGFLAVKFSEDARCSMHFALSAWLHPYQNDDKRDGVLANDRQIGIANEFR